MKPGNVLIDLDGEPRVTDFGLAKRQDIENSLTATGQVLGTPAYMAPEQGNRRRNRCYCRCVCSRSNPLHSPHRPPPFRSEFIARIADEDCGGAPVGSLSSSTSIPLALSEICLKCLAKEPTNRYPTAAALADDLARYLAGQTLTLERDSKNTSTSRRAIAVACSFACIALLLGALNFWFTDRAATPLNVVSTTTAGSESQPTSELLSQAESRLLKELETVDQALRPASSPDPNSPWNLDLLGYEAAYSTTFRNFEMDPQTDDPIQWSTTLRSRPADFREAVINGLERWEIIAANNKSDSVSFLRSLLQEIDSSSGGRR